MRRLIAVILLAFLLAGCASPPRQTQTEGGTIEVRGDTVTVSQASNPDVEAVVRIDREDGSTVTASTGSSRKDTGAIMGMKFDQYKVFSYLGAALSGLGLLLTVAAFWFPLIPRLAGPLIFIGGAGTAYMSTAIPEYGPYALVLVVLGAFIWYYHQSAAKKDPSNFEPKKAKTETNE